MTINSTSYKELLVKILEDRQKKSVTFIRLISTLVVSLVIVSYGNISIKTEWREYQSSSLQHDNKYVPMFLSILNSGFLPLVFSFPFIFEISKQDICSLL